MIRALAPSRPRGCWWGLLAAALGLLLARPAPAQAPKDGNPPAEKKAGTGKGEPAKAATKAQAPAKADVEPDEAPAADGDAAADERAVVDPTTARKAETIEVFRDPRAEAFVDPATFKELRRPRGTAPSRQQIEDMARGQVNAGQAEIQRWVEQQAADLTNHKYLDALINPEPGANPTNPALRAFERAADGLIVPLETADANRNAGFRRYYVAALRQVVPRLLDNQLHARIAGMIALSKAADADSAKLFIEQIDDANQVLMVKLWALRGLTNASNQGRDELPARTAIDAARAIVEFLDREKDAHWTIRYRALEALGSMRHASTTVGQDRPEAAEAALSYVADPKEHPMVRGWAAWALGMMRVPAKIGAKYNGALVAYHVGRAAGDAGERAAAVMGNGKADQDNPDLALRLTGLLISQFLGGLRGIDGAADSGVLNTAGLGSDQKRQVGQVADRVQAAGLAAYNLAAPGVPRSQRPQRRRDLEARVADLRSHLAKNPPADSTLVPGGAKFPIPAPKVAAGKGQ